MFLFCCGGNFILSIVFLCKCFCFVDENGGGNVILTFVFWILGGVEAQFDQSFWTTTCISIFV
jgi:hypothetical protein